MTIRNGKYDSGSIHHLVTEPASSKNKLTVMQYTGLL